MNNRAVNISSQVQNLLEDISVQKLEKWETDFKTLFKGLSSQKGLKNPDDFKLLKKGLCNWADNFQQFVLKSILGVGLRDRERFELFLKKQDSNSVNYFQGMVNEIGLKAYTLPVVTDDNIDEVKTKLKKVEEVAKYVLGTLKKGLSKAKDPIPDLWVESPQIAVGPVSVRVISKEGTSDKRIADFVHSLKDAIDAIQKKRLTPVLKSAKVLLDLQSKAEKLGIGSHTAAIYFEDTDEIKSTLIEANYNLYTSLIHEFGHRYWHRLLTSRQQKVWTDFIASQKIIVPKEALSQILDAIADFVDKNDVPINLTLVPKWTESLLEGLEERLRSNETVFVYLKALAPAIQALMKGPLILRIGIKKDQVMSAIRYNLTQTIQNGVLVNPLTDYSNTSETEAWSEVFWLYCEDKPLPELVAFQFKRLIGQA